MPIFIFNSKHQFWNDATRTFQDEPHDIRSVAEASMEIRMAARKDMTTDMVHFDEDSREAIVAYIRSIKYTKDHLKALKDMNTCLR